MNVTNSTAIVFCVLSVVSVAAVCRAEGAKEQDKVLRHAVFFKFNDGTSNEDVAQVEAAFAALPKKIDAIKDYQAGKNVSRLGLADGFTHCFLLTFADEAGRAEYLPHPDHKAFGAGLRPHLEKVFVIDYWGTKARARRDRELKHALFLKFKESATAEEIKAVEEAIARLPSQCATIRAFEWGTNNSPEKHDEGFTHCFMFTFDDLEGLRAYAAVPAHREVVGQIAAAAEKARVMDFWTQDQEDGGSTGQASSGTSGGSN